MGFQESLDLIVFIFSNIVLAPVTYANCLLGNFPRHQKPKTIDILLLYTL